MSLKLLLNLKFVETFLQVVKKCKVVVSDVLHVVNL